MFKTFAKLYASVSRAGPAPAIEPDPGETFPMFSAPTSSSVQLMQRILSTSAVRPSYNPEAALSSAQLAKWEEFIRSPTPAAQIIEGLEAELATLLGGELGAPASPGVSRPTSPVSSAPTPVGMRSPRLAPSAAFLPPRSALTPDLGPLSLPMLPAISTSSPASPPPDIDWPPDGHRTTQDWNRLSVGAGPQNGIQYCLSTTERSLVALECAGRVAGYPSHFYLLTGAALMGGALYTAAFAHMYPADSWLGVPPVAMPLVGHFGPVPRYTTVDPLPSALMSALVNQLPKELSGPIVLDPVPDGLRHSIAAGADTFHQIKYAVGPGGAVYAAPVSAQPSDALFPGAPIGLNPPGSSGDVGPAQVWAVGRLLQSSLVPMLASYRHATSPSVSSGDAHFVPYSQGMSQLAVYYTTDLGGHDTGSFHPFSDPFGPESWTNSAFRRWLYLTTQAYPQFHVGATPADNQLLSKALGYTSQYSGGSRFTRADTHSASQVITARVSIDSMIYAAVESVRVESKPIRITALLLERISDILGHACWLAPLAGPDVKASTLLTVFGNALSTCDLQWLARNLGALGRPATLEVNGHSAHLRVHASTSNLRQQLEVARHQAWLDLPAGHQSYLCSLTRLPLHLRYPGPIHHH